MMQTRELTERLQALGDHLDEHRARWEPDQQPSTSPATSPLSRVGFTAAVTITLVAGSLIVARARDADGPAAGSQTTTSPTALPMTDVEPAEQRPRLPTAYPAVDDQIPDADPAIGNYSMSGGDNPARVQSLIARTGDGTMAVGLQIEAVAAIADVVPVGIEHTTTTVWGRTADVYIEPGEPEIQTVVIPARAGESPGATLRISGLRPLDVLTNVDEFVWVTPVPPVDDSGRPPFTLNFGDTLPDGFELVVPPATVPNGALVGTLSVNSTSTVEGNLIQVSTTDPLPYEAAAWPLTRVEINGTPGWMSDGPGHAVTWRVNDETYALVGGSATPEEALTVAQSVTFIDEASWRDRYNIPEPDFTMINDPLSPTGTTVIVPESHAAEPTTTIIR